MINLFPMTKEEFTQFMVVSMESFSQDQVIAGTWAAESAQENIQNLRQQILPDDLRTKNHYFFAIKTEETVVGGLWIMIESEEDQQQVFVTDIQIYPEYRRMGYGTQAFLVMEEIVKTMGLDTIVLHVFTHNQKARDMYQKLGYHGEDTMMWKKLP